MKRPFSGITMQRLTTSFFVILSSLVVLVPDAHGHHSASAFYDFSRVGEIEGRVKNVRWSNPHVIVEIMGLNGNGVEELWKIEGDSINALQRRDVNVESVRVGERVRVLGALSRHGRPEMFAGVLYLADGREVVLTDAIAVQLGIMRQGLSTGEIVSAVDGADTTPERRNRIFRVWSRSIPEGYPYSETDHRFTAGALAAQAAWDPLSDDPGLRCEPQGMPGVIVNPYPVEFVDRGDEIVLRIEEWDAVRRIHMTQDGDNRAPATPLGHSVGHWEDETLVVRTTNISWPYYDDLGTPQSEAMEVEERFTLAENGIRLEYVQTAFDPLTFTEPAVLKGYFWLVAGTEIKPFNCQVSD
jgi:hypothetical protein